MATADVPGPNRESPDTPGGSRIGSPDKLLQTLVYVVNSSAADVRKALSERELQGTGGISIGITLVVGGSVISGNLIGAQEYFIGVGDAIKEGTTSKGGQSFRDALSQRFHELASEYDEEGPSDEKELPSYIHLKEARVFAAGTDPMPSEGMWWRGRLDRVDGFTLGALSLG